MTNQPFRIDDLKAVLVKKLGINIGLIRRLGGSSAFNYEVVSAEGEFRFLLKCSPPSRQKLFDLLVDHLNVLGGTRAVRRIFERECPAKFGNCNLVCLEWCSGESMFPDQLTDAQFLVFLEDYLGFSESMQRVKRLQDPVPAITWLKATLEKCHGWGGVILRKCLMDINVRNLECESSRMRVIHGDFHHANFHFAEGRLSGVYDLESMKLGCPADDIVRYFTCSVEHLRWYGYYRVRRMLHLFRLAIDHLPYSRCDWEAAIDGRFLRKAFMQTGKRAKVGLLTAVNLAFRYRFYRKLKKIANIVG